MDSLVSIITPVHNGEQFLRQCLDSVKGQTYSNWEHIIINDCSEDTSEAIIREYARKDNRIHYKALTVNSGAGLARNKGIEMAVGDYIAFLDSDDLWYSTKLAEQIAFMQENDYPFTFTSYDKIDEQGSRLPKKLTVKERISYQKALFKNPIGCLTVIYDVRFFGKQYMPAIRKRQDYALWLSLLKKTDAFGLDKILASYRVRTDSISSNKLGLLKYEWKIYREEEGFSVMRSLFYVVSAIVLKMKSYF